MAHGIKFNFSEELLSTLKSQDHSNTLFLIIKVHDEQLNLARKVVRNQGTVTSLEFTKLSQSLVKDEPTIILYAKPETVTFWELIAFIPDIAPIKEKTVYSYVVACLKDVISHDRISVEKHVTDVEDLLWRNYESSKQQPIAKPWSNRELAQQALDKSESIAISEAQGSILPSSGFHTVSYPLSEKAMKDIALLKSETVNWLQFSLDDRLETMTTVAAKSVSNIDLSQYLDAKEPQFYLYRLPNSLFALISYFPESSTMRKRMVYSISKAKFADQLRSMGCDALRKIDIHTPSELSESTLQERSRQRSATLFKPDEKMYQAGDNIRPMTHRATDKLKNVSQWESASNPVTNRNQQAAPVSRDRFKTVSTPGTLAQIMNIKSNVSPNPKEVVIPPSSAYQ